MIQGTMNLGQAGVVSLVSMAIVFIVLLLLYVVLTVSGKLSTRKSAAAPAAAAPAATPAASAPPAQDDGELLAVLSAAVAEYERSGRNPMVRNRQDLD